MIDDLPELAPNVPCPVCGMMDHGITFCPVLNGMPLDEDDGPTFGPRPLP